MSERETIALPGGYWFELDEFFGDESYSLRYTNKNGVEQTIAEDVALDDARAFAAALQLPTDEKATSRAPVGLVDGGLADIMSDVAAFLGADPAQPRPFDIASVLPRQRAILWRDLIREEQRELSDAIGLEDIVQIAHEAVDLIYVTAGMMVESGIPLHAVWREVHAANMRKVDPVTGAVRHREDGKILKPEGWQKADVAAALASSTQPEAAGQDVKNPYKVALPTRDRLAEVIGSFPLFTSTAEPGWLRVIGDAFEGGPEKRTEAVYQLVDDILAEFSLASSSDPPVIALATLSWSGFSVHGDAKSISEVQRGINAIARDEQQTTLIRHQRNEIGKLHARREQSSRVMPLIGPLVDAWDGMSRDSKSTVWGISSALSRCLDELKVEGDRS